MFDRFFSVFSLVSRIPAPCRIVFDPSRLDFFLPLTGLLAGICAALAALAAGFLLNSFAAASLFALLVQYLAFNLFHLDGLADTADAFGGTVSREKARDILKDSRIGVYGLFAACMCLALKAALLYLVLSRARSWVTAYLLFCSYPVAGRFAAALIPCRVSPAAAGGLGALAKGSRLSRACAGVMLASVPLFLPAALAAFTGGSVARVSGAGGAALAALLCAGVISAWYFGRLYRRRLGGYTGDALGAAIEGGEALALFFAACLTQLG